MQNLICAVVLGVIATSALFEKKNPDKVEKTIAKEAWQNTKDRAKEVQEGCNGLFDKKASKK